MPIKYTDARNDIFKDYLKLNPITNNNGLDFEKLEFDNSKQVLFKEKITGYSYIVFKYEELSKLKRNYNLYEVIPKFSQRKLFFDLDFKDNETGIKCYISVNNVIKLCNQFKDYLINTYNIQDNVNYVIQASINDNFEFDYNDNVLNSFHVVFNVYNDTFEEQIQILNDFKKLKFDLVEFIDISQCKKGGALRALNQCKEKLPNKPIRTDKIRALKINEYEPLITDNFITAINTSRDIYLKVDLREKSENEIDNKHNIIYNFSQLEQLKLYVEKLKTNDLITNTLRLNYSWSNNINLIIKVLKIEGVKWEDIINHDIIKLFLIKSKILQWDTEEALQNNINYINSICRSKKVKKVINKNFFMGLEYNQIKFIYLKLNKNKNELLYFNKLVINKQVYINIKTTAEIGDLQNNLILYDITKDTLLINCNVYNDKINKLTEIRTTKQYNLYMNKILNLNNYSFNTIQAKEIENWSETETEINNSCYYEAPVGSRKSSLRMNKDIKDILKANNKNIILMPCDTRSLCNSQYNKMKEIFNELNINLSCLKNYRYVKDIADINNNSTRLFICCYDSIYNYRHLKITHLIIDEFLNVRKRFLKIEGDNLSKEEHLNNFFGVLKKAVSIKCYDADLQNEDLNILRKYTEKDFNYYKLIGFQQTNNNVILTNEKRVKYDIINSIQNNKNFSISSNSKTHAIKLYNWIKHLNPKYKIALIEKDGAIDNDNLIVNEDLKVELTSKPELWSNYNVIIYTPTIMCGISQESNKYFYKHYGFLCCSSTDYSQTAQMLFRVRNTETNIIMLCDIKNKISSLCEETINNNVESDYIDKNYNEEVVVNEEEVKEENPIQKTVFKEYSLIETLEEKQYKFFYYKLFYTLRKWGCNLIKFDYYNNIDYKEPEIYRDYINYDNVNMLEITEYQEFNKLNFQKTITNTNNNDIDLSKNKTLKLMSYGINKLVYEKFLNHKYYKYFLFYELYNNSNEYKKYLRLSKLVNYKIKNVIFEMFNGFLTTNYEERFMKQKTKEDTLKFSKWLYCSYVLYKLFDNEVEYNKFLLLILNCECYNLDTYRNCDLSIETIGDKLLKDKYKDIERLTEIFVKMNVIKKNNDYSMFQNILKFVCEYFCFHVVFDINKIGLEEYKNDTYVITFIRNHKIPYRLENISYNLEKSTPATNQIIDMNENENNENENNENENHENENMINYEIKETIENLTKNEYDDLLNQFNSNINVYLNNKLINYNFLPKIRAFETFKDNKLITLLIKDFNIYYNNTYKHKLLSLLDNEIKNINNNIVKVSKEEIKNIVSTYINNKYDNLNNSTENIIYDYNIELLEGEIYKQTKIEYVFISNFGNVMYHNKKDNKKYKIEIEYFNYDISNNRLKNNFKYYFTDNINHENEIKYGFIYINEDIEFIDRLVAECFLTNYRNDYFIKHIDNDYTNNNVENLIMVEKWVKDNYKDLIKKKNNILMDIKKAITKEKRNETRNEKILCNICNKLYSYTNKKKHNETHKITDYTKALNKIKINKKK